MKFSELPIVPRSFAAWLLAAFALALVPLVVALAVAVAQVRHLAARGEASIAQAAQMGEQSRVVLDALLAMERAARQAGVLGVDEVIEAYSRQRMRFWLAVERLAGHADLGASQAALADGERLVFEALRGGDSAAALAQWPALETRTHALIATVDDSLARERAVLAARPAVVARDVLTLAAAALPIALLAAAVFAWRLARPVHTLDAAIRRLGEGELETPIRVDGPTEFAQLGPKLDWLRLRLIELQSARRTLLQSVSHDLKTPLAAISEGRNLLADGLMGPLTREQRAVLELMASDAQRLLERINALVDAGALAGGQAMRSRIALESVVDAVLAEHALACSARGLRTLRSVEQAEVYGDAEQIRMIVDNLVSNAIKYSPDGGAISLSVGHRGAQVELTVEDEGPGVAADEAQRIFAPSARGSAAVLMRAPGSGMGLALARALAHAQGGSLRLEQHASLRGACFVLVLPESGVIDAA